MTHRLRVIALASALTLAFVGEASAHAHLKTASPAIGGVVTTAPTELDLGFSEGVNLTFTGVTVKGPGAAAVATGEAKLGASDDKTLVVPLSGTLPPGLYTVDWHALATDGHKTHGTYTFSVKP